MLGCPYSQSAGLSAVHRTCVGLDTAEALRAYRSLRQRLQGSTLPSDRAV
ncbi:hypothetical protein EMIT0324P_130076 [Pseudomonas chlororaphis]